MRGSSLLHAALRRLVADEITQHTDNLEACTVLFDVESFYDFISLSLVARAGLKLADPLRYWVLLCSRMQGVHFLTARYSGFSEGIVINNGVPAGCAQGNHAERLALYHILQKSHELHPSTTTAQWVDDLAQRTQSPPSEVVNKAVEAVLQLVQDLQEDKLAVAAKSVVIAATHRALPNRSCQLLQDMTYTLRVLTKGFGSGCVQRKKANASYHCQEMGQGWGTYEKMRDIRQVDFETGQCTIFFEDRTDRRSKLMGRRLRERRRHGSSRQDREQRKQLNVEGEAGV